MIQWILGHQALIAGLMVGILDFLFGINAKLESNGILHFIWLQAKKLKGDSAPQ